MLSAIERPGGYDPSVEFDLQTFWKLESHATNEESAKEGDSPGSGSSRELSGREDHPLGGWIVPS